MYIKNFWLMPFLMKMIVLLGLLSPWVVAVSVVMNCDAPLGMASTPVELISVIVSAIPLFLSACLIIRKKKFSRVMFILSSILLVWSPLLLEKVRGQILDPFEDMLLDLMTVAVIALYFFVSKGVRNYFNTGKP